MNYFVLKKFRMLAVIFVLMIPLSSMALKISNTQYRFCVMDDARIKDYSAASAYDLDQLSSLIGNVYWYSYNGVKIEGTKTQASYNNVVCYVNVLMTTPYDGDRYGIYHSWYKGNYGQKTYIYINVDAPTGVSLSSLPKKIRMGDETTLSPYLTGTYTPFSGSGYFHYDYTLSNDSILSISNGKIVPLKEGSVVITVDAYAKNKTYGGSYYIGRDSVEIEIVSNLDPLEMTLDKSDAVLNVGKNITISANLIPEDSKTTISWISSDENVATVDDGVVYGIGRGHCVIEAHTSNGLNTKCEITVLGEEDYKGKLNVLDVNKTWGMAREEVLRHQSNNYYLYQENTNSIVYTTMDGDMKLFVSYKFDTNGKLCASTLSMPFNQVTQKFSDDYFSQYEGEMNVVDGVETKIHGSEIVTIENSTTLYGGRLLTIGFTSFEPLEQRDDCVDLGLSVRWAKCNLGASKPAGIGDFYAWSEITSKTEYWRENYSYCNNNSNQYVFTYTNPIENICGTKYDVATTNLGDGWRTPSLAEVNELITHCTWEKEEIEGTVVYRITGPNGNSIIIPIVGEKKQAKDYSTTRLCLAIGECPSKTSESCYIITTDNDGINYKGSVGTEWKAWGYNIRPVYTK